MSERWIIIAAINGLIAVATGALGAHGLKSKLSEASLATLEVGARYQMYHALALLAVAWLAAYKPSGITNAAGICLLMGIILFSGSLYGLSLTGWKWLGPITPIGGVLFMVGWALMAAAAFRSPPPPATP